MTRHHDLPDPTAQDGIHAMHQDALLSLSEPHAAHDAGEPAPQTAAAAAPPPADAPAPSIEQLLRAELARTGVSMEDFLRGLGVQLALLQGIERSKRILASVVQALPELVTAAGSETPPPTSPPDEPTPGASEPPPTFGQLLRAERSRACLTLRDLAGRIGVPWLHLFDVEHGKAVLASSSQLDRLIEAMGTSDETAAALRSAWADSFPDPLFPDGSAPVAAEPATVDTSVPAVPATPNSPRWTPAACNGCDPTEHVAGCTAKAELDLLEQLDGLGGRVAELVRRYRGACDRYWTDMPSRVRLEGDARQLRARAEMAEAELEAARDTVRAEGPELRARAESAERERDQAVGLLAASVIPELRSRVESAERERDELQRRLDDDAREHASHIANLHHAMAHLEAEHGDQVAELKREIDRVSELRDPTGELVRLRRERNELRQQIADMPAVSGDVAELLAALLADELDAAGHWLALTLSLSADGELVARTEDGREAKAPFAPARDLRDQIADLDIALRARGAAGANEPADPVQPAATEPAAATATHMMNTTRAMLERGPIRVTVDTRAPGVEVPPSLRGYKDVSIRLSYSKKTPARVGLNGIAVTILDDEEPPFHCFLPWIAVRGVEGEPDPALSRQLAEVTP